MMTSILVLTDFSSPSDRALDQARVIARGIGAEVHLVHRVVPPPPQPPTELLDRLEDAEKFDFLLKEILERPEREAAESLAARAAGLRADGISVTTHLEKTGELFDSLERVIEAVKPGLLVIGSHGRSGVRKWLMGSLAEKVLRHTTVDLLSLHEDSPVAGSSGGIGELLVAVDFSDDSRRALEAAYRLLDALGGSLCLLHVLEERFLPPGLGETPTALEADESLRSRLEQVLREELRGRPGEVVLAGGNVPQEIDRVAREREASMVVLGTRGASGLRHFLVGSVAERVVALCHLPVLVVR